MRSLSLLSIFICCVCFTSTPVSAQITIENPPVASKADNKVEDSETGGGLASKLDLKAPASTAKPTIAKSPAAMNTTTRLRSEDLLPASTKAWLSVPDAQQLANSFEETQLGKLAENKTLKPFADSLKSQVKEWINGQNVRLNLAVDQLEGVNSGEICFAGVLTDNGGQHGIVLLMDVSQTREKAEKLSQQIADRLAERGAVEKQKSIQGVKYSHATIDDPKLFRTPRNNFKALVDVAGPAKSTWFLVANNEAVFRDVLRRLTTPNPQSVETLAAQTSFKTVMQKTDLKPYAGHIRWFVDPFGYMELAQRIRDDEAVSKVPRDSIAKKLADAGFDAFRGIGGQVAVKTREHEVLHRTYVYAKRDGEPGRAKVFDLFDFDVPSNASAPLPSWVPENASSLIMGNWNTQKALGAFGFFWDAQTEKGSWLRLLADLKQDPNLRFDLKGVVEQLGNRFVIVASTEKPITAESERVIIGVLLKGRQQFVFDNLSRANPNARVIKVGGYQVIEIDSTIVDDDVDDLDDIDDLELDDDEEILDEEEEEEPRFELFQKRYIVVHQNYLFVCNNKNYLRKILAKRKSKIVNAPDYKQVESALAKLKDQETVAWRRFGRLDLGLEINYEMMRSGQMGTAQTMLARVINQMFANQAAEKARLAGKEIDPDAVRNQELEGNKLPQDYSSSIAPYLGPTGGMLEIFEDGWRMTGVILQKNTAVGTLGSDTRDKTIYEANSKNN